MVSAIKSISDHANRTHRGGNGARVIGRDGGRVIGRDGKRRDEGREQVKKARRKV